MKQQLENSRPTANIARINLKNLFSKLDSHELIENIALFLLSRICFMDYLLSPFGIAFFSILFFRKKRPYYVIFSALGVLSTAIPTFYFKYLGSILITMSVQLIFSNELQHKKRIAAIITTTSVFLTGCVYVLIEGFFAFDVLLLLLESGLVFISFFIFDKALLSIKTAFVKKTFDPLGLMAVVTLSAAVVFSVSLTKNFWPLSHMAAIFVILLLGLIYGFEVSTPTGAILGFALCFSTTYPAQMICIYTLSSLFSGLLSRYGRLAASGAFSVSSLIITLILCPEANGILTVSYVAAACLLLYFVPDKLLVQNITLRHRPRKETTAMQKVKDATDLKITETIDSIDSIGTIFHEIIDSFKETRYDTCQEVFRATADNVCKNCSLCRFCWEKDRDKTQEITGRMYSLMKSKNTIAPKDIPKDFSDMCIRSEAFICELNKNFESLKVTKMWAGKVLESKKLVAEQFKNTSMILNSLKESIAQKTDFIPDAEHKITAELNRHGITADEICVHHKDGYSVTIDKMNCDSKAECDTVIASLISEILEVPMEKALSECGSSICHVAFYEKPKFRADVAISSTTKKNSGGSGDNAVVFSVDPGRVAIVLADGMGSGEMANFQSSIVIKLAKKLITTGFNLATCVRLINDILMTNADKDTFSTIDMCVLNLYTGVAEFVKAGSSNTYLKLQNTFDIVTASSLPAGLMHGVQPDCDKKIICSGDFIIMVTDGITDILDTEKKNSIFKMLEDFSGTPQELSDKILDLAVKKSNGAPSDDMTVAVCGISRNE